jgi:acyl-CoA synthetase (AMP-forming)/AMP-acid ligase II
VLYYTGSIEQEALAQFLRGYLPRYMIPSACERLERMPLTPNGKLDRKALAAKATEQK